MTGSLFIILFLWIIACKKEDEKKLSRQDLARQQEMLLRANKYLVEKDAELIEGYASRREWEMEVTETGLFYQIYEKGDGRKAETGLHVKINYRVSLLDGTVCYSSDTNGAKSFELGHSREETGLEQGILMMREGDKARFILPPHLAYGLLGDENKIPARSILVYEVELISVSSSKQ